MANKNLPDYQQLQKDIVRCKDFDDPLERKLWVLAIITKALSSYDIKPVLIGGCALEYYTLGGYSTYDVDIAVIDHQKLTEIMDSLGFQKEGRFWHRQDLDIVIESPAGSLDKQNAPLTEVFIEDYVCYIIGLEDLIIDRLNGYVHWKWEDDGRYVKLLFKSYFKRLDWSYLEKRAEEELTLNTLIQLKKEILL